MKLWIITNNEESLPRIHRRSGPSIIYYGIFVVGAAQVHRADRALSLPTDPNWFMSQAPVHSARFPVKLSPDQISNLHNSKNKSFYPVEGRPRSSNIIKMKRLTVKDFKSRKLIALTAQGWSLVSVIHCQEWTFSVHHHLTLFRPWVKWPLVGSRIFKTDS